jgi:hypothetical protein
MRFVVEWHEAPGVRDRVLAATWARLEISADGRAVFDLVAKGSQRSGIYGPLLPLAEWVVENWWNLLYEPSPASPLVPARKAPRWMQQWVHRHNLLAAREGMALPDATIVRDGDEIVVMWVPDARHEENGGVHFVGSGQVRVGADSFAAAAADLVDRTLARMQDVVGECEEATALAAAWEAIQTAEAEEEFICQSIAVLGGDPYDPAEASDGLVEHLASLRSSVPSELLNDFLEGTTILKFSDASAWLESHREYLGNGSQAPADSLVAWSAGPSAHAVGYQVARDARDVLGLPPTDPVVDLGSVLAAGLGWDADVVCTVRDMASFDALVGFARSSRKPILMSRELGLLSNRFMMARAAFFVVTGTLSRGRLLTSAVTRSQRAGRAFAAEFLAPSAALAKRVGGRVGEAEITTLAEEFNVSTRLIEHQIENHGIGSVSP